MATKGFKFALVGLLDKDGKLISDPAKGVGAHGIFSVNAETSKGTVGANMTGLEGTATALYGSDQKVDTTYGLAQPQVAFSANDMPYDVVEKMLGHVANDYGGFDAVPGQKPDVAMIYATRSFRTGRFVYKLFFHGSCSQPEKNEQTDNQQENIVADALTYSPSANTKNGAPYTTVYQDEPNFNLKKMLQAVYPGIADGLVDENGVTSDGSNSQPNTPNPNTPNPNTPNP
ncbi:phage tail protein [Xylocopilactobacillus apis]|uniref:Phage tail protein n=1 Tax=Xylocopilactobacillus apis TaxID=2932183 RepID=A0AAU9D016_9LACO|nr:phage tail protein [Xylocopilactobacillus apis]BDR56878.1 hypothetical protein KIMC2_14400 [Xylocopilactobacillus apis]